MGAAGFSWTVIGPGAGEQASVAAAFAHGIAAIDLEGLADVDQPSSWWAMAAGLVLTGAVGACRPAVPVPGHAAVFCRRQNHFHGREGEITALVGRLRVGEREIF